MLLNYFINCWKIIHGSTHSYELEDLTSFMVFWSFQTRTYFSLGSMDYHPLKATTINDHHLIFIWLSNWWRKIFLLLNPQSHRLLKVSILSLPPCKSRFIYFQTELLKLAQNEHCNNLVSKPNKSLIFNTSCHQKLHKKIFIQAAKKTP